MGIDIGTKRLGVALSDKSQRIATPLAVLDMDAVQLDPTLFTELVDDWVIDRFVIGLPLSLDGTEGPHAQRTRQIAARLLGARIVDATFVDERLSTTQAKSALREAGRSEKQSRGVVDKVAATLILQSYLDAQKAES